MKAVFDFTKISQLEVQDNSFNYSACFLQIMGKPFLQHILEYVGRLGIQEWEIYLSNSANEVEKFIGDGERWGVKISYHLLKEKANMLPRLVTDFVGIGTEPFLFCNEEHLPFITQADLALEQCFFTHTGEDTRWKVCTLESFESELKSNQVEFLSVASATEYLESMEKVFSRKGKGLVVFGKELRDGIWVGPGTKVPVTCTLVAPVYLGAQVRLGDQSIIGPNVEIGNGCIIGENSFVKESSILTGSFVGKNLDVNGCIVNQNRILNAHLGAVYRATDEMLFMAVEQSDDFYVKVPVSIWSRFLALILLIVTSPLLLGLALFTRNKYHRTVVSIPQHETTSSKMKTQVMTIFKRRSETSGNLWKHLLWHLIPHLYLVVTRKARFFGIPYKTVQEYEALTPQWQELYLQSIPGLISEADILYDEYPDDQMLFACEMYYRVMENRSYNIVLFGKYIKRLFLNSTQ